MYSSGTAIETLGVNMVNEKNILLLLEPENNLFGLA